MAKNHWWVYSDRGRSGRRAIRGGKRCCREASVEVIRLAESMCMANSGFEAADMTDGQDPLGFESGVFRLTVDLHVFHDAPRHPRG
jgi:hypothetical protein